MTVKVSLIAAVADNGVIGADNALIWRLPSDFAFFKRITMGKPIVMGRNTFESIGKPLPGRVNIVVSRKSGYQPDGVIVISDLDAALEHARTMAEADGLDEIMVIGGGAIYAAAMPVADRLYVTHVHLHPEGDTHFPEIDPAQWFEVDREEVARGERDSADFDIVIYERRATEASH